MYMYSTATQLSAAAAASCSKCGMDLNEKSGWTERNTKREFYAHTKDNDSDCGTKCQSAPDFTKLRQRLMGYAKSYTPPEWEPLPLPAWTPITELPNTIDDG